MAKVLERDISKQWIATYLKAHPGAYAFRIHDCPWEAKKFDYLIFGEDGISFATEFKVDRRQKYRYTIDELPNHQRKALEQFKNGNTRRSQVVVYHVVTETWHKLEVL
jgi:hypothetical protein